MLLGLSINGSGFSDGDLVTFDLGACEVSLRLPVIPCNRGHYDEVTDLRCFSHAATDSWASGPSGYKFLELSRQTWRFEHDVSCDDVAVCTLSVSLMEAGAESFTDNSLLNGDMFFEFVKNVLVAENVDQVDMCAMDSAWPSIDNNFYMQVMDGFPVSGVKAKFGYQEGSGHCPIAFIPLGERFVLVASTDMGSLHYPDRKNPFTNEELKQFEFDLFDEFLSHIRVTYSPELLAKISPPQLA